VSGRDVVERLEADFRSLEEPFTVVFESREDARALLFALAGDYLAGLPEWRSRQAHGLLAIVSALSKVEGDIRKE
jgi:hypothetical protein